MQVALAPPVSCTERLPDGRKVACRPTESLVSGCRDGLPLAGVRRLNPGDKPTSPAEFARMREDVWRKRGEASGICLLVYAKFWAETDVGRARTLAALGAVRGAWEIKRCGPDPPTISREPNGYRWFFSVYLTVLQLGPVAGGSDAWREALRQAAASPEAFTTHVDLAKVCEPTTPRPEAEWPAIREELRRSLTDAPRADGAR